MSGLNDNLFEDLLAAVFLILIRPESLRLRLF